MAPAGDGAGLSAAAEPSSPPRLVSVHTSGGADPATPTKSKSRDGGGSSDADEGLTPATSPTSSNNTNGDAHTISSTSSDSGAAVGSLALLPAGALNDGGVRAMDVTVTVLSLHGIIAQSSKKKESKKLSSKRNKAGSKSQANPTATIVASFSQPIGKDRVFLTHVPSSPVSLQTTATTSAGGLKKASSNASTISSNASLSSAGSHSNTGNDGSNIHKPAVHWPTLVDVDELDSDDGMSPTAALSTLQFQRQFVREGRGRYVPQTCPITLSVSRNGKMALLGRANLVVNGEEAGEASATVPISSGVRGNRSVKKKMGLGKKKGEMATVKVSKGDAFHFGLEGGAMLRVLVNVSDPEKKKKKKSKERKEATPAAASGDEMEAMSRVSTGHDVADDTLASISECRERNHEGEEQLSLEGLSVEGLDDDDASLEQDDYYAQMQRHMMENTEVRSLRQQLANTEHTNKVLQMELANARQEATLALDNERECEEENDRLREELAEARRESGQSKAELERARANRSTLKEDLATVQTESELLPIYETRVSELLEELKKRDLEVQCLRDEIGELRGHYKDQLADSLLWDNDDGTERKPILPEALRKLTAFRREEGRSPEDLLWDKDDEVKTPTGHEEKEAVGAPPPDDATEEEGDETMAPSVASSATSGTTPNVDNFASILQGAKPIKEDSIREEEEETTESPVDGEDADAMNNDEGEGEDPVEDSSPKKGGWGVHRRIGAGIMGLEERMRLRQQKFREQQEKIEQQKLAEQKAEPKEPGLGSVIVSRISSHGDAGKEPADEEDKGEDENVEEKEKGADDEAKEGDCAETDDTLSPEDSTNGEANQNEEDKLIFRKSSYNQVLLAESIDELERAVLSDHPSSSAAPSSTQDGDDSSQAEVQSETCDPVQCENNSEHAKEESLSPTDSSSDSEAGDEQRAEEKDTGKDEEKQALANATSEKDPSFIGTVKSNDEAEADNEFDEFIRVCSSDALDG